MFIVKAAGADIPSQIDAMANATQLWLIASNSERPKPHPDQIAVLCVYGINHKTLQSKMKQKQSKLRQAPGQQNMNCRIKYFVIIV